MAQHVGVADVYAKYGVADGRHEYELLRRVSHWTEGEMEKEKAMSALPSVRPTYVLANAFAEILDLFSFSS